MRGGQKARASLGILADESQKILFVKFSLYYDDHIEYLGYSAFMSHDGNQGKA